MGSDRVTVFRAAAVQSSAGPVYRPGTVVVRDVDQGAGRGEANSREVVWVGPTAQEPAKWVPEDLAFGGQVSGGQTSGVTTSGVTTSGAMTSGAMTSGGRVVALPGCLLVPGMVNAHTHLELTAIGPRPYGGDFVGWVSMLREQGPGGGDPGTGLGSDDGFVAAARDGAGLSLASGVTAVGDICRGPAVSAAWRGVGLGGTGFWELFGLGPPMDASGLERIGGATDGLQPHAPYSAGPGLFAAAAASGRPVATHLAETPDEARFVATGDGPFRDLLERLGKWDGALAGPYRQGLTPVQWMEPHLERVPWLLAHCNYVSDEDIAILAQTGASVAYCPIASEYFGHRDHRYRDMLAAGVNVCLGTDSIVCQPGDEPQPLGILPQMRRLYRRDGTDPRVLLAMATGHGRKALGLTGVDTDFYAVKIDPADPMDPLTQALLNDEPMQELCDG